jgi:hypothetical protein
VSFDRLLIGRLLDFQEPLRKLRDDIAEARLPSNSKSAVELVRSAIDVLLDDLTNVTEELVELSSSEDKSRRSGILHYSLEHFLHYVSTAIFGSATIPVPLFQMLEMIEEELPSEWRFGFLVMSERELGTLPLNTILAKILEPFVSASRFLEMEGVRWLFLVPPSILEDSLNWPLLSHEVAHVLEMSQFHVVESLYGESLRTAQPYDTARMRYGHAEEYQSDFVAASFFGPAFVHRLLSNYFSREVFVSPSHPSWEERIKALLEVGLPRLPSKDAYLDLIKRDLEGLQVRAGVISRNLVNLENVLDETQKRIQGQLSHFDCDGTAFRAARERMSQFLPYTRDYRALLNAAVQEEEAALETYSKRNLSTADRVKREYQYLVLDCVRLSYVNMHYERRMAAERAAKEAEAELKRPT